MNFIQRFLIRRKHTKKRFKMTVTMQVTEPQALALQAMFEDWNSLASMGSSREVGFYVDGDGDFKPKCKVRINRTITRLTPEMAQAAVIKDDKGNRIYDYDPIAWLLRKLRNPEPPKPDVADDFVNIMADEIRKEIDNELINKLMNRPLAQEITSETVITTQEVFGLYFDYDLENNCNVWRCRGFGKTYSEFYEWLYTKHIKQEYEDFPWHYWSFINAEDETEIVKLWVNRNNENVQT